MNNELINHVVLRIYRKCNLRSLPIDCFELLKNYDYKVYTYNELKYINSELYQLCFAYSNDAFIHKVTKIAAYNDKNSIWRIRFSLMHELGHLLLEHLGDSKCNENEADYFASCVLAPRILIHKLGCRKADDIHDTFGLSYTASNRALADYKNWIYKASQQFPVKPSQPEVQLERLFAAQIKKRSAPPQPEPRSVSPVLKQKSFMEDENFHISDKTLYTRLRNNPSEKRNAKMLGISIEEYLEYRYNFRFLY